MGCRLPIDVIISFDIDFGSCFNRFGGSRRGGRRRSASIDCCHSLHKVYFLGSLTLSIFEILDGNDLALTLVVMVGKRIGQLVVRMSNDARAKEHWEKE